MVEKDGVDALTMRRLADEIGTKPMSLYRHVPDKRSLLLELLDEVARQVTDRPLPASPDPKQRLIDTMLEAYRVLDANPWVVQAVLAVEELPPGALRLSEHMFAAMRQAGLPEHVAVAAHTAIWHYTWGHTFIGHLSAASARAYDRHGLADREEYGELRRVVPAMLEMQGRDTYRDGLVALVEGFFTR